MTGTCGNRNERARGNPLRLSALSALCACFAFLGCQEEVVRPSVTLEAADTADQVLYGMQHYVTDQGLRRSLVEADTAYVYQNTQMVEMRGVKVTFYGPSGEITSTVTGDSGTYLTRDGSMSARGNVVAVTPDGRTLRSQELKYDSRSQKISSDKPFVYDRADQHLEGNGFTSDPDFRNVVTKQPRGGQRPNAKPGDSTGFLLPGQ